ncbi:DivIVA domain-containing protein [Ihubacter sp. rT4E-8]|uniref:DivIVA domain-containing protein n=1 Tax=unclassified Ihubacter TaxID=2633299 RepID=UPI003C7C8B7C
MITPLEIENKEFSKSMRGYNAEEVDEFLDEIILDLQALLAEKEQLQAQVEKLNLDMAQYKKSESSVINTLESAKKLMNDISESAEKRAEIIIRNAQMDAESIQREAKDSVSKLTEEGERLAVKVSRFRERYRQLLEDELNQLEGSSEDLFADLEAEFMPASMTERHEKERTPARETVRETMVRKIPEAETVSKGDERAYTQQLQRDTSNDTMVLDRSLEDILRDDFGLSDRNESSSDKSSDDMAKTRVISWDDK